MVESQIQHNSCHNYLRRNLHSFVVDKQDVCVWHEFHLSLGAKVEHATSKHSDVSVVSEVEQT